MKVQLHNLLSILDAIFKIGRSFLHSKQNISAADDYSKIAKFLSLSSKEEIKL